MNYIEAPNAIQGTQPVVFAAGGITGCPNWQLDLRRQLETFNPESLPRLLGKYERTPLPEFTLLNPRRDREWGSPGASTEQISWEYKALHAAHVILFWFARGSDNPIVLFEYGVHTTRLLHVSPPLRAIVVGVDPEYSRKNDVMIQTQLMRDPGGEAPGRFSPVCHSFGAFVTTAISMIIEVKNILVIEKIIEVGRQDPKLNSLR